MASYQARQRDPLLDSNTQAILEQRSKELLGLGLLALAALTAMILGSYTPTDPSWLSATDEPARNLLGRFGASIASPLYMIVGVASWGFVAVFAAWGLRFLMHRGEERAIPRLFFALVGIAIVSVYAATITPFESWSHSFGLGGMFGETLLGTLVNLLPIKATLGFKFLAIVTAFGSIAMSLYVLGFTRPEIKRMGRFLITGTVMTYAILLRILGKGAVGATIAARTMGAKTSEIRAARSERRAFEAQALAEAEAATAQEYYSAPPIAAPTNRVLRAEPVFAEAPGHPAPHEQYHAQEQDYLTDFAAESQPAPTPAAEPKGLLARMPSLLKRAVEPQPELIETPEYQGAVIDEGDGDARIKARIADVIKTRARQTPIPGAMRDEPPLTAAVRRHRKGPEPMILAASMTHAEGDQAPLAAPVLGRATEFAAEYTSAPMMAQTAPVETGLQDAHSYAAPAPAADPAPLPTQRFVPQPAAPEPKAVVQHAQRKAPQPSRKAIAEAQPALAFEDSAAEYETPPLSLLSSPATVERHHLSDEALEENARMLENVLDDYGVKGEIVSVRPGPVVTMYELEPAPGLKASRVIGLADDIARSMSAISARVSTVPGRSVIGIELPNVNREKVVLREILSARDFGDSNMKLPLALGKDIGGDAVVANLAKMPHLLIAGTTGSGKSVAINTMILSLLYKLTPDECRLIMIDPKMLELSVYDGIPHLLSPVVTDPKKAVVALKWVVGEMEERYRKMSKMGVRNIDGYNGRVKDALDKGEMFKRTVQTGFDDDTGEPIFETEEFQPERIPYIVVVVDEMADLMMVAGKEIEACIQRLAQMARASGIHLIMATQRPSVDVITGTIKANFPTRISFQVTSKIDSRTILGEQGAEQLLGMGDMLYMAGGSKITRVHGPFVSDEEVEEIVNHLKAYGPPEYIGGVVEGPAEGTESDIDAVLGLGGNSDVEDALYDTAVAIVIKDRKCSTSYIQRKLSVGYNKAARLVEQMEDAGLVSPANHVGKREILVPEQH
ncbi:MAG: DNA translocase FtsK [Paracoccaceae bacterium]